MIPLTIILHIKCAVIGTYTFFVLIYEVLDGKDHIIHKNIPHVVKLSSNAYRNILNNVVKIKIFLSLKHIKLFLKNIFSAIGGNIIVDATNKINFNQFSTLNGIISVSSFGKTLSKMLVRIKVTAKSKFLELPVSKIFYHFLNL